MPKRVITSTVSGRNIHFKPILLGKTSLIHPRCKAYAGKFYDGTIYLQALKSTYYTLSLVLARLDKPTKLKVDTTKPGKCLCYAIEGCLTIQYDNNDLIAVPAGRFNILPISNSEIFFQAGTSVHIFITLPNNCYPDMEFRSPYLTSVSLNELGSPIHQVILNWPARSYDNEVISNKVKLLITEDYSSNKSAQLLFNSLMVDIIRSSMNLIVDTENLVYNFN